MVNFLLLDKEFFLRDCQFSSFKASGKGGQKRNKKETAVRLTHLPTDISVEVCEHRQQSVNREKACRKLRIKLAYAFKFELSMEQLPEISLNINDKNWNFPILLQRIFFFLRANNYILSKTSLDLNIGKENLLKVLFRDKTVWNFFNQSRFNHGLSLIKR